MKTHWILIVILLSRIAFQNLDAQTPILHLSFDNTLNGMGGEAPSFHNEVIPISFVAGKAGNAGYFSTGNVLRYLAANNITALRGSMCYWIKPDWESSADHKVLVYGESGGMLFGTDGNGYFASLINRATGQGEIYANFGAQEWGNDEWIHVAQVWDRDASDNRDALRVYVNGELISRNDPGRAASNIHEISQNDFQIGGNGTEHSLNAALDELMIFPYPLSESEIQAVYQMADLPVSLVLNFDGDPLGQAGEQPSFYHTGIPLVFGKGIVNQAAFFPEGNELKFQAAENIHDLQGTIHYWINTDWYEPGDHCLFNYGNSSHFMRIELIDNQYRFIISHDHQELHVDLAMTDWEPGTWHHLAHTWNSQAETAKDALKTYFDGELAEINEQELNGSLLRSIGGEFQIGGSGSEKSLSAWLDLFNITDSELTESDIKALYQQHIPTKENSSLLLDFEDQLLGNSMEEPLESMALSYAEGRFGRGLLLNPQNLLKYDLAGNFNSKKGSLSCWVFPNWTINSAHTLFQIVDGESFKIGTNTSGEFVFRIGATSEPESLFEAAFSTGLIPQQTWTHLCFNWNYRAESSQEALEVFVNGELVAQNGTQTESWRLPALFGELMQIGGSGHQETFSGKIDRFFILDECPELTEILAIMNGAYPVVPGMTFFSNTEIKLLPGTFVIPDSENTGVITVQNKNGLILDGSNFVAQGDNGKGHFLRLENCHNLTIKNFNGIADYFYGIEAIHCQDILIDNCIISGNKKDTEGWIHIWGGPDRAHGGGIFLKGCRNVVITNNTLQNQNDGIAAYSCDYLTISENNCSQNTGYGIRLFQTNQSHIRGNNCSNINRQTDPSDCAAILMYFCREDTVIGNDFSFSGDGIFINDNKNLENALPGFEGGYNYFYDNDCSYSPHNAIESVFSEGNVFEKNNCSFSQYGFWLGYSHHLQVNNNTIYQNRSSGIAIDRGYSNTLNSNIIKSNSVGMEIWQDDSPISGYSQQKSADYRISKNYIIGNQVGMLVAETDRLLATSNLFITNRDGFDLLGSCEGDSLTGNRFSNTINNHISNRSQDLLEASNNSYGINEIAQIDCKILNAQDGPNYGPVIWQPFIESTDPQLQTMPPEDLAEADFEWISFAGDGKSTELSWDSLDFISGNYSLYGHSLSTQEVTAHYTPSSLIPARWDLSNLDELVFYIKINHLSQLKLQQAEIRLGTECNDYYKYSLLSMKTLNEAREWTEIRIPVEGNTQWRRSQFGTPDLAAISYFEILLNSWGEGFEFWLDGVGFSYTSSITQSDNPVFLIGHPYPNPTREQWTMELDFPEDQEVHFQVKSILGTVIHNLPSELITGGKRTVQRKLPKLAPGIYFLEVRWNSGKATRQLIIN